MHRPLQFDKQPARLINFNPRSEKYGAERKPAGDVKLSLVVDRSALAAFDPVLPQLLFLQPSEARANPDEVEALEPRLPFVEPLQWKQDYPGYGVTITFGLELIEPIELDDMELSDFVIEPQKGGTARLTFRASGHPTTEQSGELCALIQQDVIVSLIAPTADAVAEEAAPAAQGDLLAEPGERGVLVKSIDCQLHGGRHMHQVKVILSDDEEVYVGEWASRPTIDEIAGALFDTLEQTVEFTPAAREAYESEVAEA